MPNSIAKSNRSATLLFGEKQWTGLTAVPPDGIFALAGRANAAKGSKANLVIGAYRDAEGLPYPLKVVRKAEQRLLDMNMNYEYQPIAGHTGFIAASVEMMFADTLTLGTNAVAVQTLGGTGAASVAAQLFAMANDPQKVRVYISNPTWPNHYALFHAAGFAGNMYAYHYYNAETRGLDLDGFKADIEAAPAGSIFVLHQCAHNPTGVDPTHAQWEELADLFLEKQHQIFFDSAYQGYATGSLDNDAFAARLFVKKGIDVLCGQSFSKNLGLYSERMGVLTVSSKRDPSLLPVLFSNLESIIRSTYSNAPAHGARLVHMILTDKTLRAEWEAELAGMADRIKTMRELVYGHLTKLQTPGTWAHILEQIGMFSYLGLSTEQSKYCQDHNVFITLTGRANMAGLTEETTLLLAKTIDAAVREVPASA